MTIRGFFRLGVAFSVLMAVSGAGADAGAASRGAVWCKTDQAPTIKVGAETKPIRYDFSKSEKDLNHFKVDTVSPYAKNVITDVGGLMQGGIELSQSIRLNTMTNYGTRETCVIYDSVTVTLKIDPTIFIAREFPRGSCKHNAIMAHEHRHIAIDQEIVNKYARLIADALKADINRAPLAGPVPMVEVARVQKEMQMRQQGVVKTLAAQMDHERSKRQQALDNIQEYEQVNKLCPPTVTRR